MEHSEEEFQRIGFHPNAGVFIPGWVSALTGRWGEPPKFTTVGELCQDGSLVAPEYSEIPEQLVEEGILPPERPPSYEHDFDNQWALRDAEVLAGLSRADLQALTNDENTQAGVYPAMIRTGQASGQMSIRIGSQAELPTADGTREVSEGYGGYWQPSEVNGERVTTTIIDEFSGPEEIYSNHAEQLLGREGWTVVAGKEYAAWLGDDPKVLVVRTDGQIPDRDKPNVDLDGVWRSYRDQSYAPESDPVDYTTQMQAQQGAVHTGPSVG